MKIIATTVASALFVAIVRATAAETDAPAPVAPRLLSQTGLYANVAQLKIDPMNRRFSPQYPLWSDGATKTRWVRLPAGSTIDVSDLEKWELPVGTKFWKEFSFDGRKVETRFLWRTSKDRWVFASYAWNHAQTDAELASENGIADITEIGGGKRHSIPSITECRSCHDSNRTEILGFNALQLSDDRDPNALHAEPLAAGTITLKTLDGDGLMAPKRPELISTPPRIAAASPTTRAALGYLSSNCGSCHNTDGSIASLGLNLRQSGMANPRFGDLRRSEPSDAPDCNAALATTVNKRGHWVVPEAPDQSRVINPGHPESSAIIRRVKSRRPISQMPSIGTVLVDQAAVDLLTSWVRDHSDELTRSLAQCGSRAR